MSYAHRTLFVCYFVCFVGENGNRSLDGKLQLITSPKRGENCAITEDKCIITVDHDLSNINSH